MACNTCKKPKEIKLDPIMNYNFTEDELTKAYMEGNKTSYTQQEVEWFYELYNRVFNANRKPTTCGKCFATVRKQLTQLYESRGK